MAFLNSWMVVPAIVGLFYAIVLCIGLWELRSVTTVSAHVVANRSLGIFYIFFLGVSEYYSAASFVGMPAWAYQYGAPVYVLLVAPPVLWLIVFWLGPLIWEAGKQWGCVTQAQLFRIRYDSPALGKLAAIIAVVSLVPYIAIQMMASGYMFEVFTENRVPYWIGSLIIYAVVAAYTFGGGLASIGRVAILKGLFMLAVVIWLFFLVRSQIGGNLTGFFHLIAQAHPSHMTLPGNENFMGYVYWSTTVIVGAVGGAMYPHFFINFYSASSARSIKLQSAISPFYLVLTVALIVIGFGGILLKPGVSPSDQMIVQMIKSVAPYWVMGVFCAAALAAGTSTAAPVLLAVAATLSKDLIAAMKKTKTTDEQVKWMIRALILVVTTVAYFFALLKLSTIVYIAVALLGVTAQFFPLTIASLYRRHSSGISAFMGLLVGTLVTVFFTLGPIKNPRGIHAGLIGLAVNVLVFGVAGYFTKTKSTERVNKLLDPMAASLRLNGKSLIVVCGLAAFLLLAIVPPIFIVNRIEPFVFGLPLFLFYVLAYIAFTIVFLFVAYQQRA